ncbi:hypothetical protein [Butyrivibrio sp. INlla14]|uniref:hypothetical protein n=1 Tax=Butyrivibrio sp. INlla14 TaxID=1520808 RepID=UPI000876C235|nr:hypothetical protein [Butyrivibrio sp. INlla14]SCY23617.1 hypothetical protein SAMN02910371_01519 [Butyrivibrio sp. INlla14]
MKKKTLGVILTLALGISLVACGSKKENADVTANTETGSIFEPIDDSAAAQDKDTDKDTSSSLPEGVEFNTADGFYSGTLQSSGKDKIGAANEYGSLYTIIYQAQIIDNNLVIYGNFGYRNFQDQDIVSVSDNGIYAFTITDDTTFQMVGGEEGPEIVSKEDFDNYLTQLMDSQLYFEIEIADNHATSVSISS